ncbi:MAG: hypothetical protein K0Q46_6470 [Rhodococcus erythropolis]|jgi:hypothetical protein|nr:hypothetical protein [Rhodococcus erythropolis]MDF2899684.1 hypothetical protein [Rhodococcus erythropolis]
MPIDEAMAYELAEAWLTPYLDAQRMTASHPLRDAAFDAADAEVMGSYRDLDTEDWDDGPYTAQVLCEQIGQDVATLLRGVAEFVVVQQVRADAEADR